MKIAVTSSLLLALLGCARGANQPAPATAQASRGSCASSSIRELPFRTGTLGLSGLAVQSMNGKRDVFFASEKTHALYRVPSQCLSRRCDEIRKYKRSLGVGEPLREYEIESLAWHEPSQALWAGLEGREETVPPYVVKLALDEAAGTYSFVAGASNRWPMESGEGWEDAVFGGERGVEALCATERYVVAVIEAKPRGRLPLWVYDLEAPRNPVQRWSLDFGERKHGRVSGLDCRAGSDETVIDVLAIEGNLKPRISQILRFQLEPESRERTVRLDESHIALKLLRYHGGRLNLEGIGWLDNGDVVLVHDNNNSSGEKENKILRVDAACLRDSP